MPTAGRWPVQIGRWKGLLAALGLSKQGSQAMLVLHDAGLWAVCQAGARRSLQLVHVWPSFAWVALRFQDSDATARGKSLELTIWKAGLTANEWRDLRRCVAAQQAMPGRRHNKEKP